MRCIIALVNMSIIFAKLGFGADPAGGGALTRMCLSAPHSRKRPLPTFQKFHDTRPGALTRVSTVHEWPLRQPDKLSAAGNEWSLVPKLFQYRIDFAITFVSSVFNAFH